MERKVGKVTDYFARPVVAGIKVEAPMKVGDRVRFKGHTTDFELTVSSMEEDHHEIKETSSGHDIGVKVPDRVRAGDYVYKIDDSD